MMRGKHIVIGVTGGIAAYKSVYLVRLLQEAGADVRVIMTAAATRFVGTETFAALTRHDVAVDIFPKSGDEISRNWTRHIQWGEWADLLVVAPCTANTLGRIVHGITDDMLTATILAARCPVLLCPTMDGEMYKAPSTRANLQKAADFGFHLMAPGAGYLASGLEGPGRLPEPVEIRDKIVELLETGVKPSRSSADTDKPANDNQDSMVGGSEDSPAGETKDNTVGGILNSAASDSGTGPLLNRKVLVTAGATREYLDPVRFLSNPSTGKMGCAMAQAAHDMGATVILLHAAAVDLSRLSASIDTLTFESAEDLFEKVKKHSGADVVIMTAAVSDFRPASRSEHKVKKEEAPDSLTLERTPDILQWLGKNRRAGQVLIGFAMETQNLEERAREKLLKKNADWIVANNLREEDAGFAVDTNRILLIGPETSHHVEGSKKSVAEAVLRAVFAR